MISHGDGRKEFVGAVVREMERNGRDDSDFYALVYDRKKSCSDCRGSGWRASGDEGTAHSSDFGMSYYSDAVTSYDLILTLMDGNYKTEWVTREDRSGYTKKHPSVENRKYAVKPVSYMGIPDGFACETCGGTGKVDHPDGGYFHWIEYGTTRFACDTYCRVDATDEVKALYEEWVEKNRVRMKAGLERIEATYPKKGRRVRVVKGRKIAKGTEGTVIWHGADKYRKHYGASSEYERVGFKTDDGETHFTAGTNVEVIVDLTGDGDWVIASDLVMPGDTSGMSMTAEHWVYSPGFAYVG